MVLPQFEMWPAGLRFDQTENRIVLRHFDKIHYKNFWPCWSERRNLQRGVGKNSEKMLSVEEPEKRIL